MKELLIPLHIKSEIPLYQQICEYIKKEIQHGHLKAGEKLPSSRALANCLSVSRSTVELSYDQLVSEGYMEAVSCKGYYVCDIQGLYYTEQQKERSFAAENGRTGRKKEQKSCAEEHYRYDFALNGIDAHGFPYSAWQKLSRRVLGGADQKDFQLGNPCGEEGFRRAVAEYLYQARGVHCDAEQIIIGAGNDYLLMLLGTILSREKKIIMENPTYLTAYYDFLHMGFQVETIGQDKSGIDCHALEKSNGDVVYAMPSHQFPVGTVMPLNRRMALLAWAGKKAGRYIIEDDYDSELRYRGKPIPALKGFDSHDCVIYIGTFSKSIAPSIRVSYMVLPNRLMELYQKRKNMFSVTVSKVDQKILELFLKEGYYERHLNKMRGIYKNKHDILLRQLKEMQDICIPSGEYAGVHMLLAFQNGLTEAEAVKLAAKEGIKVYGLSEYCISGNPKTSRHVLLGYACMEEKEILEAMEILKRVWKKRIS